MTGASRSTDTLSGKRVFDGSDMTNCARNRVEHGSVLQPPDSLRTEFAQGRADRAEQRAARKDGMVPASTGP
jgi:hypothetical protein